MYTRVDATVLGKRAMRKRSKIQKVIMGIATGVPPLMYAKART